uniref:RRM domain-containing protein n=1 Tax=Oryza punctata TaxID=4537 RepID=A0A0E0LUH1_ORYPU
MVATAVEVEEGGGGSTVVRIFMGGISEGMAATNMESMFASVSHIIGVEFVRTNGYHCPSDKALAKLFSTNRFVTFVCSCY